MTKEASKPSQIIDTTKALRVYVDRTGNITADGQSVTLSTLDSKFKTLKRENGVVFYSRDNVFGDPPQQAMQVIELVVKYGLPVRFYSDNTFSQPFETN